MPVGTQATGTLTLLVEMLVQSCLQVPTLMLQMLLSQTVLEQVVEEQSFYKTTAT